MILWLYLVVRTHNWRHSLTSDVTLWRPAWRQQDCKTLVIRNCGLPNKISWKLDVFVLVELRDKSGGSGKTMSTTAILPGKFNGGDLIAWLREFDACCAANGWKASEDADQKLLKLPAFLRGQAASHFYAIPAAKRNTYATAVSELKKAMCPEAAAKIISRSLRSACYVLARTQPCTSGSWGKYYARPIPRSTTQLARRSSLASLCADCRKPPAWSYWNTTQPLLSRRWRSLSNGTGRCSVTPIRQHSLRVRPSPMTNLPAWSRWLRTWRLTRSPCRTNWLATPTEQWNATHDLRTLGNVIAAVNPDTLPTTAEEVLPHHGARSAKDLDMPQKIVQI